MQCEPSWSRICSNFKKMSSSLMMNVCIILYCSSRAVTLPFVVQGVKERLEIETSRTRGAHSDHVIQSSRRRKGIEYMILCPGSPHSYAGPAFLPSEHDELPPGVAFMVGGVQSILHCSARLTSS